VETDKKEGVKKEKKKKKQGKPSAYVKVPMNRGYIFGECSEEICGAETKCRCYSPCRPAELKGVMSCCEYCCLTTSLNCVWQSPCECLLRLCVFATCPLPPRGLLAENDGGTCDCLIRLPYWLFCMIPTLGCNCCCGCIFGCCGSCCSEIKGNVANKSLELVNKMYKGRDITVSTGEKSRSLIIQRSASNS